MKPAQKALEIFSQIATNNNLQLFIQKAIANGDGWGGLRWDFFMFMCHWYVFSGLARRVVILSKLTREFQICIRALIPSLHVLPSCSLLVLFWCTTLALPNSEVFAIDAHARYGYQCRSLPKENKWWNKTTMKQPWLGHSAYFWRAGLY